ncbi:MAG TPA: TetR/AcrR family transcriptional regulator [Flavobacteriaceae bacterium]|nr:TetR/AcrR family transcriptional regulator [Flavobacteriaceae bacterium]
MITNHKEQNTESEILNAAKRIFLLKGMDGARMQEIADEANINKSLLHYYYRSKQLLFEAVFKSAFSMLAPQLNTVMNDDSPLFDKIRNFTYNYISFVAKHPYLPNFIIQELNKNPEFLKKLVAEKHFPTIDKFKKQLEEQIALGSIKPIKAEQLFINIMALNMFPFLASPLIKAFTNTDEIEFKQLIDARKTEVADFIINSIKI